MKSILTEREIIQEFHQLILSALGCKIQEVDGYTLTNTKYILYMPCNWEDYEERKHIPSR